MSTPAATRQTSRLASAALTLVSPRGAVFLLLAILLVAVTLLNPNFAEPGQFIRFVQRVAPVAIVATATLDREIGRASCRERVSIAV